MVNWIQQRAGLTSMRLIALRQHSSLRGNSNSRAALQWLEAIRGAPCLVCGGAPPPTSRIECSVSSFPLTCSTVCDSIAQSERQETLALFKQISEDIAFTCDAKAKALFSTVLTRENKTKEVAATPRSWESAAALFSDSSSLLNDPRALRLMSAAYTFVMTLSHYMPYLYCPETCTRNHVKIQVVGARAEAMMPDHVWEELVDLDDKTSFQIQLIGNHAVAMPRKVPMVSSRLRIETFSGLYHDLVNSSKLPSYPPDAFVLFNPGIGHPRLRDLWAKTMLLILKSGRPTLITSFSLDDQVRDMHALEAHAEDFEISYIVPPEENPFRSQCFLLDPSDVFNPIQTNKYAMVVRGNPA